MNFRNFLLLEFEFEFISFWKNEFEFNLLVKKGNSVTLLVTSLFLYPYASTLASRLKTDKADYSFLNVNVNKLLMACFSFDFLEFGAFDISK